MNKNNATNIQFCVNIYTISNESLLSLGPVSITGDLFLNSGIETFLQVHLLEGLSNPELLYWNDGDKDASDLVIKGAPRLPQIVVFAEQAIPSGSTIDVMEAASSDDVLFSISTDGSVWNFYNGQSWETVTSDNQGMSGDNLKGLTSAKWSEIAPSGSYRIRAALPSESSYVNRLVVGYT